MDIELAEVRESIATVLGEECPSLAVHGFIDGRNTLDTRMLELATELGWLAIALPEEHGGIGLDATGLAVLHFELGRAAAPGPLLATSIALETLARSAAASEPAVARLIAGVLAGTATLAIAARAQAPAGDAPVWLLGEPNAAAALVPGAGDAIDVVDLAGVPLERVMIWDSTRSIVALPQGQAKPLATLAGARASFETLFAIALAADSAGAARGTLDRTIAYMKEREQFGRPIGSFQALKHRVANHEVQAHASERLVWQAVDQFGEPGPGLRLWPFLAKANVTEAAAAIAGDCVQLHGGVGYTREYDPHLFLNRVRLNEMMLAPNAVLRDRAAAVFSEAVRAGVDVLEIA